MPQTGLGGGLARQQARERRLPDSFGAIEDRMAELGYDGIEYEQRGRDWIATSFIGSYRSQAISSEGKLRAGQALVRAVSRR